MAGPLYCDHVATRTPGSASVWALALDAAGNVYVDSGPAAATQTVKVAPDGVVNRLPGSARTDGGEGRADDTALEAPTSGRLAPDLGTHLPGLPDTPEARRALAYVNGAGGVVRAGYRRLTVTLGSGLEIPIAGAEGAAAGGSPQALGDGAPALQAHFAGVRSLASDEAGNDYVADTLDGPAATVRIRFINRSSQPVTVGGGSAGAVTVAPGAIDTIAGVAGADNSGDGGPARQAAIRGTSPSLAAAPGRLYVALHSAAAGGSTADSRVRMINLGSTPIVAHGVTVPPGGIATVAGGAAGFAGDGGPARSAAFGALPGIAVDGSGGLLLADEEHHRIRRVDAAGIITTFAGTGGTGPDDGGFNGNEVRAVAARLNHPFDVKAAPDGRVYISDRLNGQVRVVDLAGVIHAVPGGGLAAEWSCSGDEGGRSTKAHPGVPYQVAADADGSVYFANAPDAQIQRIDRHGVVTTVAGRAPAAKAGATGACDPEKAGCSGFGGDGGGASDATLNFPTGLTISPRGDLYVFDTGNHRVRFINLGDDRVTVHGITVEPGDIATVAGNGTEGFAGDGGRATDAQLVGGIKSPRIGAYTLGGYLAADHDGNLFIADADDTRVRRVDASGTITTFAGEGAAGALSQCCSRPRGLALDAADNLLVGGPQIWYLNRSRQAMTVVGQTVQPGDARVVAGNLSPGIAGGSGRASEIPLSTVGLAMSRQGELYIGEWVIGGGSDVRKVDQSGSSTIAIGAGAPELNGDGLRGKLANVAVPVGLAVDTCGNLLWGDINQQAVRRFVIAGDCSLPPERPAMVARARTTGRSPWPWVAGAAAAAAVALGAVVVVRRRRRMVELR